MMAGTPEQIEHVPLYRNSTGQWLLVTTLALLALGVVTVHSALASVKEPGVWYARQDYRQTVFAVLAALVLVTLWRFDYHRLSAKGFPALAATLLGISVLMAVLVYVPGIGQKVGHASRFIKVGWGAFAITFQPAEIIKFTLIIFLAAWLTARNVNLKSFWKTFVPASLIIGVTTALVTKEDFSTGAVMGMSAVVTLLLAGVPWYYVSLYVPPAVGAGYFFLKDPYRWNRIVAWFDPWNISNPSAYQVRESLLAILSGGWWGKGLGGGMIKRGNLPEASTDFAFSVYCEEWGYFGAVLLVGLVVLWTYHAWRATAKAGDRLGQLLVGSIGFLIALQAVLHIAVALASAPTTGMGLPFVSAGGTSLVITAAATALMASVTAHRGNEFSIENAAKANGADTTKRR